MCLNYSHENLNNCALVLILNYKNAAQLDMRSLGDDSSVSNCAAIQYKGLSYHFHVNYNKLYNQLIERSRVEKRQRNQGVYYENHHIIPRCIGGTNDPENLVLLTAREHFIAHWILTKLYPNKPGIIFAFNCFNRKLHGVRNNQGQLDSYSSSKNYEYARKKVIDLLKSDNHPSKETNKIYFKNRIFINDGHICKRILIKDLIEYLDAGWKKGRLPYDRKKSIKVISKPRNPNPNFWCSEERKERLRAINLENPHCWISRGEESKQIFVSELEQYVADGWFPGIRRAFNSTNVFRYLIQGKYKIQIVLKYLNAYLDSGWTEVTWQEFKKSKNMEV